MFYNDHEPPHFHARYGEQRAIIRIDTLEILDGKLSARALKLVQEWGALHRKELEDDWLLARQMAPLKKIQPLE